MKHVRATLEELRRYISTCEAKPELEEVDVLLSMALEEARQQGCEDGLGGRQSRLSNRVSYTSLGFPLALPLGD